ncbi:MAG: tyrosine-type recombinase/integrase [Gammaproteobacteria bacterium]
MKKSKSKSTGAEAAISSHLLGDYPEQFLRQLKSQYYSPAAISRYGQCIDALGRQMRACAVDIRDLDEVQAVALITRLGQQASRRKHTAFIVRRFVNFLTALGVTKPVSPPVPDTTARGRLKRDYEEYLRRQRGLSERTIVHCWQFAVRFLEFRFNGEDGDLSQITPFDIVRFMQHLTSRGKPLRDKTPPMLLRNFFLFLFESGRTATNLAPSVPSIAHRHGATLPRHLTPEQVETLLAAVREDTPTSRRNYAMVLLLARLGLRAPEIVAMQIDDIDWRAGEILVRGKGQRHDRLPLPQEVGAAVAEYIRRDRITATRSLFVTTRAPHEPFSSGQRLNVILQHAFAKGGLERPPKYVGAHVLRHSLATQLVQRGASLAEISDMLRHRKQETTMIYAKLDIEGLRSIARPWPVAGGAK